MRRRLEPSVTANSVLVTGGVGTGSARLTAFDAALQDAGIHEANLIPISSITPASAEIRRPEPAELAASIHPGEYFPAVYAWEATAESGATPYAAVAGARLDAGHGLNVEAHGVDESRETVAERCRGMLGEMADRRSASIEGEPWVRYESMPVPRDAEWGAAVAAILYGR